jgi:VWFA-related protein
MMQRTALICLIAIVAGIVLCQEPARTVIRTETQVVLVDASVADKKGEPVRELTAKDFHIWEDGKEQTIASLSVETQAAAPEKNSKHYLVLYFDNATLQMSDQLAMRRDAARFVSAWAAPDRYISVVDFGPNLRISQGFTSLASTLTQAIAGTHATGQDSLGPTQTGRQPAQQTTTQGLSVTVAGMDASNAAAPPRGGSRGRGGPPANSDDQAAGQGSVKPFSQQDMLSGLQSVADSLASIRGRKALVLFTGGYTSSPSATQMAALISACNAANVAVYVANPTAYRALTDGTGGRTILNVNDVAGQLGHIAEREDERYVLSYAPPDSPAGSCHDLRVTVDRPGVDVEARKGYCRARPIGLTAAAKTTETNAATPHTEEPKLAASLQLPYFYSSANVARVNLAMEISTAGIKLDKSKGKPHGELHVMGVAAKADGSVAGKFDDAVQLDFATSKEAEAFGKQPYRYEYQFDLAPGQYQLRVTVASGATNLGALEAPLSIGPWDGQRLGLSGVALSKETRPVADLASTVDEASLLDGRRPLIAGSHQIIPSGSNRFHPGELSLAYVEIYQPPATEANPPRLLLRMRVLDPQTGAVKRDMGVFDASHLVRPGNPVVPVAFNLPDSLAPGAYRLEVTAAHQNVADGVTRTADFEIAQ